MNIHKLIFSLAVLVFAGGIVVGGTGAFFSDEETSTGNVFAAGALDLKVDSEAHYNHMVCEFNGDDGYWWQPEPNFVPGPDHYPAPESPCDGTWEETDLGFEHTFFNYGDLKPGDHGENTLSLHVYDNDAYACAIIDNMHDDDNGLTEPEEEDGDTTGGIGEGELSQYLRFFAWDDDGNNIWEDGEQILFSNEEGPASDVIDGVSYPLYTPQTGPLTATTTEYIGLYWCFGQITVDDQLFTLTCDGAPVDNIPQSDSMTADITFYVEQARNNDAFECPLPQNVERELVGAVLADYQTPQCDTTVASDIQGAVDAAGDGDTVCVDDGSYDETVVIDKPLTLAALNGPTNSATIEGGVQIDSSDVTVTGFIINPGDVPADPQDIGVFLNGSLDNVLISFNDIDGLGNSPTRGVLTTTGATYNNVVIDNNVIHDLTTGIYTNPVASGELTISNNDIDDNTAGIGGINGAHVANNEFEHDGVAQEAIGADPTHDSNPATVEFNNFLDGTMVNTYVGLSGDVNAENNFWGPDGGATQTGGTDEVDFEPEAGVAFPHN